MLSVIVSFCMGITESSLVVLFSVVIFFEATKGVMVINTETTYADLGGEDYSQNELDELAKQNIEQIAKEHQYDKNT